MHSRRSGFTLIELSIVLVIIGLIVGGVLVGRDLITAAAVRAEITQIEKFQQATNTFRGKYNYLPGDMPDPPSSTFGFATRPYVTGQGNGDGILQGNGYGGVGHVQSNGETVMFWVDLSKAGLIEGSYTTATPATNPGSDITGTAINLYYPQAKLASSLYVYAWSCFPTCYGGFAGNNYFGLSAVTDIAAATNYGKLVSGKGVTVAQAYKIDQKIDDGLPQSGRVIAVYLGGSGAGDPNWPDGYDLLYTPPYTGNVTGTSLTCFDNGGAGGAQSYSIAQSNGSGANCGLSFQLQ